MPISFGGKWKFFYSEQQDKGLAITFDHFVDHVQRFIRINSNPMFRKESTRSRTKVLHIEAEDRTNQETNKVECSIHPEFDNHSPPERRTSKKYSCEDRRNHAISNILCFNCLGTYQARACRSKVKCSKCSGLIFCWCMMIILRRSNQPINAGWQL